MFMERDINIQKYTEISRCYHSKHFVMNSVWYGESHERKDFLLKHYVLKTFKPNMIILIQINDADMRHDNFLKSNFESESEW